MSAPSIKQIMRTHEMRDEQLRTFAQRISKSNDTRIWVHKNIASADPWEIIERLLECISNMTGDSSLTGEAMRKIIRGRKNG